MKKNGMKLMRALVIGSVVVMPIIAQAAQPDGSANRTVINPPFWIGKDKILPVEELQTPTDDLNGSEVNKSAYVIQRANDKVNSNCVFYPQVGGLRDAVFTDKVNQTLKKFAAKYVGEKFKNVTLDYTVTHQDNKLISVFFQGVGEMDNGQKIKIVDSINVAITNEGQLVAFDNLVQDKDKARQALKKQLDRAAARKGITDTGYAGVANLYFTNMDIVFLCMPSDSRQKDFLELSVPIHEINNYLNTDIQDILTVVNG